MMLRKMSYISRWTVSLVKYVMFSQLLAHWRPKYTGRPSLSFLGIDKRTTWPTHVALTEYPVQLPLYSPFT